MTKPDSPPIPSEFDRIGGEPALRAIIADFVDRIFEDAMIGFFFQNASRERIKEFEYQHAAEFLGAPLSYEGKSIDAAHRSHPIRTGHFDRRREILRRVLIEHEVPADTIERWLAHTESFRDAITRNARC